MNKIAKDTKEALGLQVGFITKNTLLVCLLWEEGASLIRCRECRTPEEVEVLELVREHLVLVWEVHPTSGLTHNLSLLPQGIRSMELINLWDNPMHHLHMGVVEVCFKYPST